MKAIALGLFTGGVLRIIFGMGSINSTSMDISRVLLGIMVGVIVMLIVGGIAGMFKSSGTSQDGFEEHSPSNTVK